MKQAVLIVNYVLMAVIVLGDILYMNVGTLLLKGTLSGLFALLGIINLVWAIARRSLSIPYTAAMAVGLILAMLGDILLSYNFILGAGLFAGGHILYFVGYCILERYRAKDLVPTALLFLFAVGILLLVPFLDFGGSLMRYVCLGYALVISCMVGKAIGNFMSRRSRLTTILMVGSILFFFSDLMLVFRVFGDGPKITDLLCIGTYYPAQCLLAFSGFRAVEEDS